MKKFDFLRVGIGGAVGAGIRWLVLENTTTQIFPWPTLLINLLGCAALGVLIGKKLDKKTLLMLGTGLCGGLTTFSSFILDAVNHFRNKLITINL